MKKALPLLVATFFIGLAQVNAGSFEEVEKKLKDNAIDSRELNELLGKHATAWDSFTASEKQTVAKGTIISMDMETSEDIKIFERHTQAAIRCMDTKAHGLNLRSSVSVSVGMMDCSAKTYRQYCTICKP